MADNADDLNSPSISNPLDGLSDLFGSHIPNPEPEPTMVTSPECPGSLPVPQVTIVPFRTDDGHLHYKAIITNADEYPDSLYDCSSPVSSPQCRFVWDVISEDGTILQSGGISARTTIRTSGIIIADRLGPIPIKIRLRVPDCSLQSTSDLVSIPASTPSLSPTPTPVSSCPDFPTALHQHTDLPGSDYRSMDLASSDPCLCARACQDDPSCQAFTYAPAGFSGVQARCWLKNAVPARVSCESCISGIKRTEPGDERWGSPDCRTPAVPRLSFTRSEGTTTADGNRATIFWFSVDNRVDYSASLFTSAPDLPPCGSNTASSRTWISIYNQDGTYINGFCALSSPDELADLSFTIPDGQTVPHSIYVSVQDRRCNVSSSSADLAIPGMTPIPSPCPSSLPAPILVLTPHIVEGHLLYDWKVTNGDEYPDSLFPCDASGCRLTLDFIYEDGTILYSGQVTSREYLERSGIQIPADPGHTSIQLMVKDSVCALSSRSENTPIPNLATPSPDTTAPPASSCPDFPSGLLPHTDLPGSDYRSMDLASSDPCLCARACQDDPTCQAFTFAPAGFSGPEARCWLKNAVPARASCESCISGIKGSVPGDRGERTPDCSALPVPVITYTRSEPTTTADGERGTIFWFSVDNRDEYSASLFTSAPDLPPCGSNTASSRTWISIYNQDGTDMNGFCALSSPDELADLSFTIIEGNPVPGSIYITLEDRRCGLTSRSGSLPIPGISSPGRVILPAPVQVSPEDGATFHNYPRNVVFRWDPVIGAASYTLEVDCYHCCVSDQWCSDVGTIFAVEPGITGTSHEIEFVGQQNGRWRVWGVDSAGNEGVKSPWRLFTYQI